MIPIVDKGETKKVPDWEGLLEEYKDMLKRYCYASADIPIKENENGYYIDAKLSDCLYVMGGYFDSDYVSKEIMEGDFPFDAVDKEGYWHIDFLLKYYSGDYEEPSYLELLLTEAAFMISFEDQKKEEALLETNTEWLKPIPQSSLKEETEPDLVKELTEIRNKLYDDLPSGEIKAWDLIEIIKWHINDLDNFASKLHSHSSSLTPNQ